MVEAGSFRISVGGSQPGDRALKEQKVLSGTLTVK